MNLNDILVVITGILTIGIMVFLMWTLWREDYKESAEGKDNKVILSLITFKKKLYYLSRGGLLGKLFMDPIKKLIHHLEKALIQTLHWK